MGSMRSYIRYNRSDGAESLWYAVPMHFRPYLTFTGNCAEAFTRYQEIFGGPLDLLTMAEAPGGAPEGIDPDVVMHASLTTEGGAHLMGADHPDG